MKTGIIILNFNTAQDSICCVNSIKEFVKADFHIYLVDNGSSDNSGVVLTKEFDKDDKVTLILLDKNKGYSGGNNEGVVLGQRDGMDNFLILNPDVELKNDIVSIMQAKLGDSVVCVSPRVFNLSNENGQHLKKQFDYKYAIFNKKPFYYMAKLFNIDITQKYDVDKDLIFDGTACGCCLLINGKFLNGKLLFDDNVFLYCEEYILGNKLHKQGKLWCYCHDAEIVHKESVSTKKVGSPFIDYHSYLSEYYYLKAYCDLTKFQLHFIRTLRKFNFFLKAAINKNYKERYIKFKEKIKEIDKGNYKITF